MNPIHVGSALHFGKNLPIRNASRKPQSSNPTCAERIQDEINAITSASLRKSFQEQLNLARNIPPGVREEYLCRLLDEITNGNLKKRGISSGEPSLPLKTFRDNRDNMCEPSDKKDTNALTDY